MAEVNEQVQEGKGSRRRKNATKIDMTPMVDLAFLLLTFFMLTTTFSKPQKMPITLPDEPKTADQQPLINESRVLSIVLGQNDEIYWYVGITDPIVHRTNYSKEGIREVLLNQNVAIKNIVVLIKPTEQSTFSNLVDILDEMSITNIERYSLDNVTLEDEMLLNKANV